MPRPTSRKGTGVSGKPPKAPARKTGLRTVRVAQLVATLADAVRVLEALEKDARSARLESRQLVGALKRAGKAVDAVRQILERAEETVLHVGKPRPKRAARLSPPYGAGCK
jgi:hypothetical protein